MPPVPGIEAAALGASESAALGAGESALSGTASAAALHTFTLDSGASRCFFRDSTTVTPLSAPVALSLADPSRGPVLARSSTVVPCPAVPSRSLPPLPPSPAPPCLPCVVGWQRAAPHSSSFPPTEAPLQTLHLDVWGPARVRGQGHERYFLLVVDDYSRYTTVFTLRRKGEVPDVLIPWIRAVRLQLREWFETDLPVLRLHSDRGGEFSSNLLRAFCRVEGIRQTFTLPASPQQNGVAERRIGLVMEVARTSMIHAAAPHFLWPFAVPYAAHQLNLWPRVSLPETSPTLRWTGKVGDASVFRVWGCRAFVRNTSANNLSSRAVPSVFLGFVPDAPGCPPPVDPLPPQSPAPLGVSQEDPIEPVEVAVDSGAAKGAASGGAAPAGAGPGSAELERAEPGVAESGDAEPGGAEPERAEPGVAEPGGAEPGGAEPGGAEPEGAEPACAEPGGAEPGGVVLLELELLEVLEPLVPEVLVLEVLELLGLEVLLEPLEVLLELELLEVQELLEMEVLLELELELLLELALLEVLVLSVLVLEVLCGRDSFPLPTPSPYTEQPGGLTERREPASRHALPVRAGRTGRRVPRPRPPPVPGTHQMALRPSSVPLRISLPSPPASSLADGPNPESDSLHAGSPTVMCLLATLVTDLSFESTAASAFVAELVDFAARCRLDYAASLVAESEPVCPTSVEGECALGTDVLEDRQEDFECFVAAVPHLMSMLIAPEGDPDAPNIPTPRSYAEAIEGPYSSQWQSAMDAEMASWKSAGTYVDEVPPPRTNIVSGMWIFRVKRPPGSPLVFKACYVARGFSQQHGVDFFQTFSPTPKMTTLRVLLDVAAQRDYELHSLDFSTTFLQGSLHEEIWLRCPPGFIGSFPAGTKWSLWRPVYGLRQVPREWHDTLRTTLAALGFAPCTADPSLFLRTDTSLPPFYILVAYTK
ncbi:unnamed protein product [Closterium sp. Naga37s-1]|nr:unnamed protein product [Closterium sp. Naga37s-1]